MKRVKRKLVLPVWRWKGGNTSPPPPSPSVYILSCRGGCATRTRRWSILAPDIYNYCLRYFATTCSFCARLRRARICVVVVVVVVASSRANNACSRRLSFSVVSSIKQVSTSIAYVYVYCTVLYTHVRFFYERAKKKKKKKLAKFDFLIIIIIFL